MTTVDKSQSWLEDLERSQIVRTALRASLTAGVLVSIYYLAPIPHRSDKFPVLHVAVALALFVVVLAVEIRQIARSDQPMLRASVAMATVIPLFLVMFSWLYLVMSQSNLSAFGTGLSRTSALYFAITVFSTVGFGDITAKTDAARLVVAIQMLADLAVIAVVVRLIFGAADRSQRRNQERGGA